MTVPPPSPPSPRPARPPPCRPPPCARATTPANPTIAAAETILVRMFAPDAGRRPRTTSDTACRRPLLQEVADIVSCFARPQHTADVWGRVAGEHGVVDGRFDRHRLLPASQRVE